MKNRLRDTKWWKEEAAAEVTALQGETCLLPSCSSAWDHKAHIEGSGLGGRASTFVIENIAGLCEYHHDVYDGRIMQGRGQLLQEFLRFMLHTIRQERALDATQGLDTLLNYPEGSR